VVVVSSAVVPSSLVLGTSAEESLCESSGNAVSAGGVGVVTLLDGDMSVSSESVPDCPSALEQALAAAAKNTIQDAEIAERFMPHRLSDGAEPSKTFLAPNCTNVASEQATGVHFWAT
jgi:hypothetical protein